MNITIVIPVYNEAPNLRVLYERLKLELKKRPGSHEILFVDDGSRDESWQITKELAKTDPMVRAVRLAENRGETVALWVGLNRARGEVIITMDADLQNDPADLPLFLQGIEEGYDVVCGIRQERQENWLRRASTRIGNSVRRWVIKGEIQDAGCTYRAMRRSCVANLPWLKGMHRFLSDILTWQGHRVKQIVISHHPRRAGQAKYGVWNRVFTTAYDLWGARWMRKRTIDFNISEELND